MKKETLRSIAIIAVALIIILAFIAKRTVTAPLSSLNEEVARNAREAKSNEEPLEIESFSWDMITGSDKPMIIVMGEEWCQPCLRMLPDLRDLHRSERNVAIRYMDLEKNSNAHSYFPIRVTPTIAVFTAGGKPFVPPEDIGISFMMYNYRDTGEHAMTIHEGYLTRSELMAIIEALKDA